MTSSSTRAAQTAGAATWVPTRGATPVADGVRFSVWAPAARRVAVRLLAPDGSTLAEHSLERHADDVFERTVPGVAPGADYLYVLDGERALPDPASRWQPQGVHGPSRVVDPRGFAWTDDAWRGVTLPELVLYELHVGTFSEEGTFDGAIPHLAELRALGVTAIEIMPVAQFPGARNWGYDGVYPYAVQDSYGGPEGLKRLVDAAHGAGLGVILDVVYNHLGPEGNYLDAFGPYFADRYHTPWGRAVNFDGPDSDEVRRFVVENAVYWVTEYHLDGLRLDAVHGIYDFGATHVLADLTSAVHEAGERLGRPLTLIAESDLNDPRVVRTLGEHGWGFDAQWADDFHHAVHSALTGERHGYYADFGGVSAVAESLREPFVFDGRYSPHRRRRHGAPSAGLPRERFVVCVQNHDQVGNRAAGERLAALVDVERQRLAAALLLLSPYVPLLFMGEEYGETNPFQYFVSHGDADLIEAVRQGRREEFAAFGWGAEVPDPADEATFLRSRLDRSKLADPRHAAHRRLYAELLRLRRTEPALRPGGAIVRVGCDELAGWVTLGLVPARETGRELHAVFNFADQPREVPLPDGAWEPVLATASAGDAVAADAAGTVCVPRTSALLLARRGTH